MNLQEYISLVKNPNLLIEFLVDKGIFPLHVKCPQCNAPSVSLNKEELLYRCYNRYSVQKKKRKKCDYRKSARKGTFFECHLSLEKAALFIGYFLLVPHPRFNIIMRELKVSSETVADWSNYCRETCIEWCVNASQRIGGPNTIVEIDEAKIGRRKYNRGRIVEGQWVFGGIERGTKHIFLIPVANRNAETLMALIKKWILPGTTIISDCWRAYARVNREGFRHFTVNHSYNFVDPDTGAHTQNIERLWREVKGNIPRYGTRKHHFVGYIAEFLFKRKNVYEDRIIKFYEKIKQMYEH